MDESITENKSKITLPNIAFINKKNQFYSINYIGLKNVFYIECSTILLWNLDVEKVGTESSSKFWDAILKKKNAS